MHQVYKDRAAGIGHIWSDAEVIAVNPSKHPDQLELDLFAA